MGVFKNEVGRPSNETIKKRNILKVVCFILVVIILLLVAYIVNDKFGISNDKITTTNKNEVKEENISNEEAKNILKRIFGGDLSSTIFQEQKFDDIDAVRVYFAVMQSKNNNTYNNLSCIDLFGNDLKDIKDGMIYAKGNATFDNEYTGDSYLCDNYEAKNYSRKVYDYDEVNKTYKYLYGNNLEAPKENTQFTFFNPILYSSIKNAYTEAFGGRDYDRTIYAINSATKNGNELTINIKYANYRCGERDDDNENVYCNYEEFIISKNNDIKDIKTTDGVVIGDISENEITNKDYFDILNYNATFKFFLEDGVWKLKNIITE